MTPARFLLLSVVLATSASAQPSGPISGLASAASCAAADHFLLEVDASGDTQDLTCSALAASAPWSGAYLLLDASNDPLTAGLKIEIADSGSAAPAGFDELLLDCGTVACGATVYGGGIAGRVGWNLGHPGHDTTGAWWSFTPTSSLMEIGTSTAGGTVSIYSGNGTLAASIDASQNVTIAGDLTVDTPTFHVESSTNRVGIGDITPDFTLDLESASSPTLMIEDTTTPAQLYLQAQNTVGVMGTLTSHNLLLVTGGSTRAAITSVGNVGIGDTTPDENLEVVGTFGVSATAGGDGDRLQVDSSGDVGIGTTAPAYHVEILGSSGSGYFAITSSAIGSEGDYVAVNSSGDVGINDNSPSAKLDVVGDVEINLTGSEGLCLVTGSGTVCDYGLQATAPASCTVGDTYTDTSPAKCWCSAANTWSVIVGTSCT